MPRDELKDGPIQNRGCTDILCCLLFIVFFAGFTGVHWYGFMHGDPYLLLTTWDYDGNGCGYNETTLEYPYLYYPTIDIQGAAAKGASVETAKEILRYGVCVQECPTGDQ